MDSARRQVLAGGLWIAGCAAGGKAALKPGQQALRMEVVAANGPPSTQRLWLYLPPGYAADNPPWPLVFFLHGSGERGSDLQAVKSQGPPRLVDQGREFPFILASPQLDVDRRWDPHELQALSQALQRRLRIDAQRIAVTGLSLGGHGAWDWATAYPEQLAAIAPVCGYGDPARACAMRGVPVRAYHGQADSVVPLARQQAMVQALRDCGGQAQLIVYPGVGHNAWDEAYADPDLYPWLMAQRLGRNQALA
ncbi:MAG: dienelactone hydrolase family protein [Rubrivivax sp.]|nr:dienelactone hydrolase family protein [Rubrivivax sp.]